jgi:hypothetical protein
MRTSSQRREAVDLNDPPMALANLVRKPRGGDQRSRTRRRGLYSLYYIRAAEIPASPLGLLSNKSKLVNRRPSSTAFPARRGVQLRNIYILSSFILRPSPDVLLA